MEGVSGLVDCMLERVGEWVGGRVWASGLMEESGLGLWVKGGRRSERWKR